MRWGGALVAALLIGGLSPASYPGAGLTSLEAWLRTVPGEGGTAIPGAAPWLHVAHPAGVVPYIADPEGRRVILRGVVSGGLVDYWSGSDPASPRPLSLHPVDPQAYEGSCPTNAATIWQPALCRQDLADMRALGFDMLRLALSWSLLEPRAGFYDPVYLDRIAQVVGWAREEGIYVILDMHENAYSRYVARPDPPPWPGGRVTALNQLTGAPAWAVISDFWPSEVYFGQRELNPAIDAAFTNFWTNRRVEAPAGQAPGVGLEDHYIGAIAALARRFRDDPTVIGYSPFNEPWPGFIPPPAFEDLFLLPFYRRVIDAVSGAGDGLPCPASWPAVASCGYPDLGIHDRRHLWFLQPDHLRQQVDFATDVPLPVSSYPNLVNSIHAYTHQFTLDALAGQDPRHAGFPPGGFAQSYASAEVETRLLGGALFVDEFGSGPQLDEVLLSKQLREQEIHLAGATYWPWKENCTLTTTWGVYQGVFGAAADQRCLYDRGGPAAGTAGAVPQNGCLRAGKERLLARVWPRATPGNGLTYSYDPDTGAFEMRADAPAGSAPALVYVPPEVTGAVSTRGAALAVELQSDGSRLLSAVPTGGRFRVSVAAAPLHLHGCA